MTDALKHQYEKSPYPPIPLLALPRRGEGKELRCPNSDSGLRILIAGCGTLEATIVAQMHPRAEEVVAVDLSESSIRIARRRLRWMRIARPFQKLPRVHFISADVESAELGMFDYILASNVLHHVQNPAALLKTLASHLKPSGILRMVTYPKGSRYWMRETSKWLKLQGLRAETPNLVQLSRRAIRTLPWGNPIRSCFESQRETGTRTGLVDAFFNACENPLSPLQWRNACGEAGLKLIAEGQDENSRSSFLDPFLANPDTLSVWEKLQILDDTWELCANLILWLRKSECLESRPNDVDPQTLAGRLRRSEGLLKKAGKSLKEYQAWLSKEAGPRTHPKHPDELIRGLSLSEYDLDYLLSEPDSDFPARL